MAAPKSDQTPMDSDQKPKGERIAWERWAPLILSIPDVASWTSSEKHALRDVARAKGGLRESEFVARFDRHARLRSALLRLSQTESRIQ